MVQSESARSDDRKPRLVTWLTTFSVRIVGPLLRTIGRFAMHPQREGFAFLAQSLAVVHVVFDDGNERWTKPRSTHLSSLRRLGETVEIDV